MPPGIGRRLRGSKPQHWKSARQEALFGRQPALQQQRGQEQQQQGQQKQQRGQQQYDVNNCRASEVAGGTAASEAAGAALAGE